ncbi:ferredoxin [Gracilibacillus sp. YIM 98692]|uniref:ferredoxin n=1 Tax=Gracilibacillus sp. YIM 98692 TaxID=2663532 RepID=UPI0013D017D4|nr:ferredoxin [Gracilibacillus sp. YIM 98692]
MPLYTWIDQETCIACGVCGATSPNVYDYDEEGIAYSKVDNNNGTKPIAKRDEEDVLDATDNCPTESVKISKCPR